MLFKFFNWHPFYIDSELAQEPASYPQDDHTEDEQEEIEISEINGIIEDSDSGSSFEELNHS